MPSSTADTSGEFTSFTSTPPWYFRARSVATTTAAEGQMPAVRHLMSRNFSAPRSAPNPASVTTQSPNARPALVASRLLQPWAILANGPPWMNAGECSKDCTRFGARALRSSAVIAPAAPMSATVMGSRDRLWASTIRPSRSLRSANEVDRQNTAMTSLATTMSKASSRGTPPLSPPSPTTTPRSARSLRSTTRRRWMRRGSTSRSLPKWMWLSSMVAARLFAAAMAAKSPVKWRLMSSIGTTCAYPPPAAPPFIPKTGPMLGSRSASTALPTSGFDRASSLSPSARPMLVVVFPSPAGVGLMAVTRMSLPSVAVWDA